MPRSWRRQAPLAAQLKMLLPDVGEGGGQARWCLLPDAWDASQAGSSPALRLRPGGALPPALGASLPAALSPPLPLRPPLAVWEAVRLQQLRSRGGGGGNGGGL